MEGRSRDEQWLLDVVTRCGISAARASDVALQGAQMLRRLNIKVPVGLFKKGECCRRAVALELASREAGGASLRRDALVTACSASSRQYEAVLRHAENALGLVGPASARDPRPLGLFGEKQNTAALAADARRFSLLAPPHDAAALAAAVGARRRAGADYDPRRLAPSRLRRGGPRGRRRRPRGRARRAGGGAADPPSPRGRRDRRAAGAGTLLASEAVLARAARDEDAALRAETDDEEAPEAPAPAAVEEEVLDYAEPADIRALEAFEAATAPPEPEVKPLLVLRDYPDLPKANQPAANDDDEDAPAPKKRGPKKKKADEEDAPKKRGPKKQAANEEEDAPPRSGPKKKAANEEEDAAPKKRGPKKKAERDDDAPAKKRGAKAPPRRAAAKKRARRRSARTRRRSRRRRRRRRRPSRRSRCRP
ncbi:hypothetical protein JL722_13104 [Aureococcus anophagefferens]|nr:hypothetical protein JL722_13104 [Aureococcus anophagefferens]